MGHGYTRRSAEYKIQGTSNWSFRFFCGLVPKMKLSPRANSLLRLRFYSVKFFLDLYSQLGVTYQSAATHRPEPQLRSMAGKVSAPRPSSSRTWSSREKFSRSKMAQPTFGTSTCTKVNTISGGPIAEYEYVFEGVISSDSPAAGTYQFTIRTPISDIATADTTYSTLNPTPA